MPTPKAGYYNAAGTRLPSCTTVLGALSTSSNDALLHWAAKLAKDGKEWKVERERSAKLGTFIHDACERYPAEMAREPWMSDDEWAKAVRDYAAFGKWLAEVKPRIVSQEQGVVSEKLQFGGTFDMVLEISGIRYIADHKTGKHIDLPKVAAQLAAYAFALEETQAMGIKGGIILHYGPDGLRPIELSTEQLEAGLELFKAARAAYGLIRRFPG